MTLSMSTDGITQRTYPMSERMRKIIDNVNIVVPNMSKTDIIHSLMFFSASYLTDLMNDNGYDVKQAMAVINRYTAEHGYEKIQRELIAADSKVTKLDRFFDLDEESEEGSGDDGSGKDAGDVDG